VIAVPSEAQAGDTGVDRETFPDVQEQIGEDPARYLDRPIYAPGEQSSPLLTAKCRIRGIDRLAVIGAWQAVERALDRGPRQSILELLAQRRESLVEHGEREDHLEERRDIDEERSVDWYAIDDGERVPLAEYQQSASAKLASRGSGARAATDGGDER
jgi:hypothetical protein